MKHGRRIKIVIPLWIVVFLVTALPIATQADVPMLINYQGYLTNASGTPLSGSRRVNFYLYNVESGGTEFWTEEQTVDLTAGVINVQLGAVSPFAGGDFLISDVYLEIEIFNASTGWETLTPRQRLTSSAFAVRAGDADTFEGHTLAELDADYVNVGEADTVTSAMVAPNSLTAADLAANSVNASEISTGAVGTLEIANGSVTATDLAEDYVNTTGDTMTGTLVLTENLSLPATTLTTGIIRSGSNTLIHTYGAGNFFAGENAGNLFMTGDRNTASGLQALYSNTEGYYNTASGYQALYYNTTGYRNTASGSYALQSNTVGSSNTASGTFALYSNTEGYSNTASGYYALQSNTVGNSNTASGSYTLYFNTTGYDNTASGSEALLENTTGIHDTALGTRAGYTNETGNGNTFIGCDSDASAADLINATALGYNAEVNGSNRVRIGNTYVSQIGGNVGWSNLSDIRRKEDVEDITLGLDFINTLRPVQFSLIDGNGGLDLGFIAQDIEALLGTGYNIIGIGGDSDRTLSLRYTDLIAPMAKAIQEQQEIIERQNGLITELQSAVVEMQEKVAAMQADR